MLYLKPYRGQTKCFFNSEEAQRSHRHGQLDTQVLTQTDNDKILHIIQRKVLKGTHLLVEIKEIQAGYLHSPYFKALYQYLLQNRLPNSKLAI